MKNILKVTLVSTVLFSVLACTATSDTNSSSNVSETAVSEPSLISNLQVREPISQAKPNASLASSTNGELSLKQIMSNPDWIGRQPQSAFFSPLGDKIYYSRKREGEAVNDIYVTQATKGNGSKLALQDLHKQSKNVLNDPRFNFVAWTFQGNIFVQFRDTKLIKQLTRDIYAAHNLAYVNNEAVEGISFQRGNSFYTVDAKSGLQSQVFNWQFADAEKANEAAKDYIAAEQQKLIQYVQTERKNKRDSFNQKAAIAKANNTIMAQTVYLNKEQTSVYASLSPKGTHAILVTRDNKPTRDASDIMPDYIEENGRIKAQSVRQRVADAKPHSHYIYSVDIKSGEVSLISFKNLPGYNEDVLKAVKEENAKAKGETYVSNRLPRHIRLMVGGYASEKPIVWHQSNKQVALMLEAWDNKDRWLVTLNLYESSFETQHRMHDEAWVNYRFNQFGWLQNSQNLYFLSEHSGYSQLYTKALNADVIAITQGQFVVDSVQLSHNNDYFYFKANIKHPGIYEIYRVNTAGGEIEPLTDLNGLTDFVLSPNNDSLLLTHSSLTMPPELYTLALSEQASPERLTNTVSDAFLAIDWTSPSVVAIESSNTEQAIYSRVYLPKDNNSNANLENKRPAVVFNHGAGYLQNAHLGWSGYFREFMFHSFLSQQGYVVLDMDYRASAGYGRKWRTAIYRQMGTPEVEDLHDGVDWLVNNANVDRGRVGTYGGSYGGFLTFMSLFKSPELFQSGAALRPVSDWAHYNFPYTSNILNTPDVDPIAYERSSPIYFAEGLNKPLLINAPMVDNNVFFVDVVRLVQVLIELEKEDFETAIYPVEPHGFVQPSSWLDEYRRIFKLFESTLQ